jgi:membrane-bound ClpP family serine protease
VGKVVDMKDYYQTNKGRLLGIGGILIIVGLILYFARHQEVVLVLPIVGIVLFIAGVIYKPRKKTEASEAQQAEFLDLPHSPSIYDAFQEVHSSIDYQRALPGLNSLSKPKK